MADKFNGRFKLQSVDHVVEFYKATGVSQAEIDQYADFEDPAKGFELVQKIEGDDYTLEYHMGGKTVHEEKYKLGVTRDAKLDEIKYTIKTFFEGDKLVDITNRPGIKESRYERSIDGDKMIVVMSNAEVAVKSTRVFVRV